MKTFSAKPADIKKEWLVIDATSLVLGRLASEISMILRGKHKPSYTPHLDCGDNVIVINADKIALTGNKLARKDGKIYYRHTGFPGGIKETTAGKMLEGKYPERVLDLAVSRMITRGPLGRKQLGNLYIYSGSEHPHAAQTPTPYDFAAKNTKNKR
ncbi:MAG: 50S ribosomal protein L13 [Rickettsiaceae bacterium]|nr:50S ribosomal protein L13 [Rickettsiaceae bacterium]